MWGMTLYDRFKSLDVYRKLPSDFVQPTVSVSMVSSVIMAVLFINEFRTYREIKTDSHMYIDVNRGGNKLNINIDIDLIHLPCSILSLDLQDIMGVHSINVEGSLKKYRLDGKGKVINEEDYSVNGEGPQKMPDYEKVKIQVKAKEGCSIKGHIVVNKVPGNFHISSHAYGPIIQRLAGEGLLTLDLNHRINHLSFGNNEDLKKIKRSFSDGVLNPIDGTEKIKNNNRIVYEYYMKVVPTTYVDVSGNYYYVNQFTSNSNETLSPMMLPSLYFRFELSPITVEYNQYREHFLYFFIQICAIIGGIFSVTGIIDALVHKSMVAILRKAQMGKLG